MLLQPAADSIFALGLHTQGCFYSGTQGGGNRDLTVHFQDNGMTDGTSGQAFNNLHMSICAVDRCTARDDAGWAADGCTVTDATGTSVADLGIVDVAAGFTGTCTVSCAADGAAFTVSGTTACTAPTPPQCGAGNQLLNGFCEPCPVARTFRKIERCCCICISGGLL